MKLWVSELRWIYLKINVQSVQIKKKSLIVWKSSEISNETIANIPSCKMSQFIRWCILFKTMEKIAGVVNTSVKIA